MILIHFINYTKLLLNVYYKKNIFKFLSKIYDFLIKIFDKHVSFKYKIIRDGLSPPPMIINRNINRNKL